MKFCIYCGQKLNDGDLICPNPACAKPLPVGWDAGQSQRQTFENAKKERLKKQAQEQEEKRRREEAQKQEQQRQEMQRQKQQRQPERPAVQPGSEKKKSRLPIILILIAVIAVAAIFLGRSCLGGKSADLLPGKGSSGTSTGGTAADSADGTGHESGGSTAQEILYSDGGTVTLTAAVRSMTLGVQGNDLEGAVWSSDNESVVYVDSTGTVTALSDGSAIITVESAAQGVGYTWTVNAEFSGIHSYEFVLRDCTWQEAFEDAAQQGGYLVNINSQEEWDYLLSEISARGMDKDVFYVGGARLSEDHEYRWADANGDLYGELLNGNGESWCSSQWMAGEPSFQDGDTPETYMNIFYYSGENRWVLNDCPNDITPYYSGKTAYIIEYE